MPMRPAVPLVAAALATVADGRTTFLQRMLPPVEGCTGLVNRGTHFSVEVAVGTPPQKFDVVADTGSNTLIVPSCQCQKSGNCDKGDSCFIGTNRSSTFSVFEGPKGPRSLYLTFGSGSILGVLVEDVVEVAQYKTRMEDGLMLMTNKFLNFGGPFGGILGLGLPQREEPTPAPQEHAPQEHQQRQGLDDLLRRLREALGGQQPWQAEPFQTQSIGQGQQPSQKRPPGFLEQANISRFSMCFNYNTDGVLRLGTSTRGTAHGSIGTEHWGLGFNGVSIGSASATVSTCKAQEAKKGRATPCGAIPDSGTTLIMAPREHLMNLFEDLCERWPRCTENHTTLVKAAKAARQAAAEVYGFNPWDIRAASKARVLQQLLLDCHNWMDKKDGLKEMPPIFLHVTGSNGTEQTLKLPPHAYVLEQEMRHTGHAAQLLEVDRSSTAQVCSPAFGVMEYITKANGPVWILGTPIFYEFSIGYDLSATPPSISFSPISSEPCVSCGKSAGLVTAEFVGKPRFLPGPARLPTGLDLEQPL